MGNSRGVYEGECDYMGAPYGEGTFVSNDDIPLISKGTFLDFERHGLS